MKQSLEQLRKEVYPIKIHYNDYYYPYKLSNNDKIYLELYRSAGCDTYKADLLMSDLVSTATIRTIKRGLISLGLVKRTDISNTEDAKEFTIKNSHVGLVCDWCGNTSYVLQKHHYPIPASKGGTDTVDICPNCHYTYHKVFGDEE